MYHDNYLFFRPNHWVKLIYFSAQNFNHSVTRVQNMELPSAAFSWFFNRLSSRHEEYSVITCHHITRRCLITRMSKLSGRCHNPSLTGACHCPGSPLSSAANYVRARRLHFLLTELYLFLHFLCLSAVFSLPFVLNLSPGLSLRFDNEGGKDLRRVGKLLTD